MVTLKNQALVAFEKVTELRTVHAAARELGLTQAAVTKRIRGLESDLGVTLFLRSRRGMSLTEEGKALRQFCKSTKEAEGILVSRILGASREEISLTVAGPTSAISSRIARDCLKIYGKHPFLRLNFQSDDHSNLVERVRRGEVDLAIVPPELVPNEMESKLLAPDRYMLVACREWKRRELWEILEKERIIDYYESDQTTLRYLRKFHLENHVKRSRLFVNENEALAFLISEGVGFGTLTQEVARPYLERAKLISLNQGQVLEDPLALVWYSRSRKMAYFDDLIRSIR